MREVEGFLEAQAKELGEHSPEYLELEKYIERALSTDVAREIATVLDNDYQEVEAKDLLRVLLPGIQFTHAEWNTKIPETFPLIDLWERYCPLLAKRSIALDPENHTLIGLLDQAERILVEGDVLFCPLSIEEMLATVSQYKTDNDSKLSDDGTDLSTSEKKLQFALDFLMKCDEGTWRETLDYLIGPDGYEYKK